MRSSGRSYVSAQPGEGTGEAPTVESGVPTVEGCVLAVASGAPSVERSAAPYKFSSATVQPTAKIGMGQ